MKNNISVNIKEKLKKRVYKLAKESKKDTSYHLNKALEDYLDEIDDLREAMLRLEDGNDKVLTSKELRKSLGI